MAVQWAYGCVRLCPFGPNGMRTSACAHILYKCRCRTPAPKPLMESLSRRLSLVRFWRRHAGSDSHATGPLNSFFCAKEIAARVCRLLFPQYYSACVFLLAAQHDGVWLQVTKANEPRAAADKKHAAHDKSTEITSGEMCRSGALPRYAYFLA